MGAMLVADDRCDLFVTSGALCAAAPPTLAGMIEVRGVGIVRLPHRPEARIGVAVRLTNPAVIPRLPEPARYRPPPPLELPEPQLPYEILLAPFETSAPAKILAAAAEFARALRR
jgi:HPr kinase/phosphorylase